mmetsp:Transcript_19422/g.28341  ORF Transcript_19422/g.28341 Transcript_19422/m.28341 type:complete len:204 (-) Transcript_19422:727-1338(-)|eukprot:CAMPEP_0197243660 /NCGR_PEP_ID=MMETSP1429-20130617/9045_1 /TAXON_ID=49237 /ORGANISM="Chaetoceros  sp., Strain UNC1202" /LENGTH=203 /DNA_ID=CAMNT_0042703915 /DNA_START=64 /DNA_END=675 /DNA_ORIENTATION=-
MLSSALQRGVSSIFKSSNVNAIKKHPQWIQCLSSSTATAGAGISEEEKLFHHFRVSPDNEETQQPRKKFESPRKRANKMFAEISQSTKAQMHNPKVHDVEFRVGDAIELTMVSQGGVNSSDIEKIRGVVLGIERKNSLGGGFYLRDVVFGEPVDRKIPFYSPLLKEITVLEKNFVFKGKRKVKRAKLYYLRDRLPQETKVTKY